jgi:hypothetical protein
MLPQPPRPAQDANIARAILRALIEAHSAGTSPVTIVLDETTRDGLQDLGLGYWSAGPNTWSLFNVPVVVGVVPGWRLRVSSEPGGAGISKS